MSYLPARSILSSYDRFLGRALLLVALPLANAMAAGWLGAQPKAKPTFVNVSPDLSGPTPNCPAPCISGGSGGRVHSVASSASRPSDFYAASELGGLFKRTGASWTHVSSFLPTKTWDVAVDPKGDIVYATSFYDGRIPTLAGIQVSPDRGQTWNRPASVNPPASLCEPGRVGAPSAFGISIRPGATNEVLAGTNCGLALSFDSGASWEYVDPASTGGHAKSVWDVVALEGGLTYACGQDGVMSSPDGKAGWTMLTTPSVTTRQGTTAYTGFCSLDVPRNAPEWVFLSLRLSVPPTQISSLSRRRARGVSAPRTTRAPRESYWRIPRDRHS